MKQTKEDWLLQQNAENGVILTTQDIKKSKQTAKRQMKQTAVEWLCEAIDKELIDFLESRTDVNELSMAMLKAKREAKQMEREQIMELLNSELLKFLKKWNGVIDGGDLSTLAKFIEQIEQTQKTK